MPIRIQQFTETMISNIKHRSYKFPYGMFYIMNTTSPIGPTLYLWRDGRWRMRCMYSLQEHAYYQTYELAQKTLEKYYSKKIPKQ